MHVFWLFKKHFHHLAMLRGCLTQDVITLMESSSIPDEKFMKFPITVRRTVMNYLFSQHILPGPVPAE